MVDAVHPSAQSICSQSATKDCRKKLISTVVSCTNRAQPADLPTRGVRPEQLANRGLWWEGPEFLLLDPENWDEQPLLYETTEAAAERRTLESICRNIVLAVRTTALENSQVGDYVIGIIQSILAFDKGSRVADLVRKAVARFRNRTLELEDSASLAIQRAQNQSFVALKGALIRHDIPEQKYWPLRPYLDKNGLIRINGRLTPGLECGKETAHPILLHKDMVVTRLILWEIHAVKLRHCGGVNTLLAQVRKQYWVIQGNAGAREVVRNCYFCARMIARPSKLPLPPLHLSRSGSVQVALKAFQEVGIDFCGPFNVRVGRSSQKRYALIVACCTTRAINVEICYALNGQSCLAALERHCARYSQPRYINSDNGSNFLASARHLEERIEVLRTQHLPEHRRCIPTYNGTLIPPPHLRGRVMLSAL